MFLVKCSSSLRNELILMKLYTVAVYYRRICMNEEKLVRNISREIICSTRTGVSICDLTHIVLVVIR